MMKLNHRNGCRKRNQKRGVKNKIFCTAFALALPLLSSIFNGCERPPEAYVPEVCIRSQDENYTGDRYSCNVLAKSEIEPEDDFHVHGTAIYFDMWSKRVFYKSNLSNTKPSCISNEIGTMQNLSSGKIIFSPRSLSGGISDDCDRDRKKGRVTSMKLYDIVNDTLIDTGLSHITCWCDPEPVVLKDNLIFYQKRSAVPYRVDIHVYDLNTGISSLIATESPYSSFGKMVANKRAVLTWPVSEKGIDIVYLDGERKNIEGAVDYLNVYGYLGDDYLAVRIYGEQTLIKLYSFDTLELLATFEVGDYPNDDFIVSNNKLAFINKEHGITVYDPVTGETEVMDFMELIDDCGPEVRNLFNNWTPWVGLKSSGENSAIYTVGGGILGVSFTVDGVTGRPIYKVIDF